MRKVLLDANFIITSVKNKIDFYEELFMEGYKIIIPEEVMRELEKLDNKAVLDFLGKKEFSKIKLNSRNVDNGIVKYAGENPDVVIATLDRAIQLKVKRKNRIMVIRSNKKFEVI